MSGQESSAGSRLRGTSSTSSSDDYFDAAADVAPTPPPRPPPPRPTALPNDRRASCPVASLASPLQVASPSKKIRDTPSAVRRKKLDELRFAMSAEFRSSGESVSSGAVSSSASASHSSPPPAPPSIPTNSVSLPETPSRGVSAPRDQKAATTTVPILPPPPPPRLGPAPVAAKDIYSSGSCSSASSKSNTLDKDAAGSESKSNSLDRRMRGPSFPPFSAVATSKSHSLTRDYSSSFSSGDYYLSFADEQQAEEERQRKDSKVVELIEALTSDLLPGGRSLPGVSEEPRLSVVDERASPERAEPSPPKAAALDAASNRSSQPDIVASATMAAAMAAAGGAADDEKPVAPPRHKKSSNSSGSDPSAPLVQSTSLPHIQLDSTALVDRENTLVERADSGESRRPHTSGRAAAASRTLPSKPARQHQASATAAGHAESTPAIDPISQQIESRRLSLKYPQSPYAPSAVSSSMNSESSSMRSSFDADRLSVASSSAAHYLSSAKSAASRYRRRVSKTVGRVVNSALSTAKTAAEEVSHKLGTENSSMLSGESTEDEGENADKVGIVRARRPKKGPHDFEQLRVVQNFRGEHAGAVWTVRFSLCGRLLATAGQDNLIRVWVLKTHFSYFSAMRDKYNVEAARKGASSQFNSASDTLLMMSDDLEASVSALDAHRTGADEDSETTSPETISDDCWAPFAPKPFSCHRGHTADVLDLSWSKNFFILSGSMDKTVRLWHISRTECLCVFQHVDFVTSIAFLPKDDRYFLSGSLDGKLRLWHIPDKKVAVWNEVEGARLITSLCFVKNGKFAVAGTFDGRCIFYTTEQLKYHTMIDVRSTRGKNARGHKVTGLAVHGDKLLVTSNDSRIRLYDLRDLTLTCKFKGATNYSSQIRAGFSPDGRHIVCGSEDRRVYLWRTATDTLTPITVRKDRNDSWEQIRVHTAVVTAAVFAPKAELVFEQIEAARRRSVGAPASLAELAAASGRPAAAAAATAAGRTMAGHVVVTADCEGTVFVLLNRVRVKAGASSFFPE